MSQECGVTVENEVLGTLVNAVHRDVQQANIATEELKMLILELSKRKRLGFRLVNVISEAMIKNRSDNIGRSPVAYSGIIAVQRGCT